MTTQPSLLAHVPLDPASYLPMPPEAYRGGVPPGPVRRRSVSPAGGFARPRRGRLIAVTGARGGAGASVLSAVIARAAAGSGLSCLLVDGDELGAGLDLLLGAEDAPGMRWPDLARARGSLAPGTLQQGLPVIDGISVLAWDRAAPAAGAAPALGVAGSAGVAPVSGVASEALAAVLEAGLAEHDLVVADLPRSAGSLAQLGQFGELVDLGLLVVPAEVRAASAGAKVMARVLAGVGDVRLVVRGPAPTGLTATAIGAVLGRPIAAHLRPEPGLAAALDRGEPPGLRRRSPLTRAAHAILAEVAELGAR